MTEPAMIAPPTFAIARPEAGEYAPYYGRYVSLVEGDNILTTLDQQRHDTMMMLSGRSEQDGEYRYAPGKWTAKEVLGHVCDSERVFAYRALRISRADPTPMEGFEQDDYVRNGPFGHRPLADWIDDFVAVRRATLSLLRNLDEAAWMRRGIANKNEVSGARHRLHHRGTRTAPPRDSAGKIFRRKPWIESHANIGDEGGNTPVGYAES